MSSVTLSDPVISSLGRRPDLIREFPFLRMPALPSKRAGCKCRAGKVDRAALSAATERIKQSLIGLPVERKRRFKALLRVQSITLFVRVNGAIKKHVI